MNKKNNLKEILSPKGGLHYAIYSTLFLIFSALQFVVITGYYSSTRLAKNKKQRTLNTIQLRFSG
ncbi:MAG: hypothetical protein KDF59_02005 [Nitrosomonas sp.]|nr:hypothetical protein [Nitrosomonas sp.]